MAKYCSNCGEKVKENQDVCLKCGVSLNKEKASDLSDAPKSRIAAGLLALFFGSLGVHNFYLGYNNKAVIQLVLTIVGWIIIIGPIISGIWAFIEAIMLFAGSIDKDAAGNKLGN